MRNTGLSLIELIVGIGIITILFSIGWVSLPNIEKESQLGLYTVEIKDFLQQAQSQTVNGIESSVYFETSRFVLFPGAVFVEGDPQNQEKELPVGSTLSMINLPSGVIGFEKITGYVKDFADPISLTLLDSQTGKTRVISINKLGMVEIE